MVVMAGLHSRHAYAGTAGTKAGLVPEIKLPRSQGLAQWRQENDGGAFARAANVCRPQVPFAALKRALLTVHGIARQPLWSGAVKRLEIMPAASGRDVVCARNGLEQFIRTEGLDEQVVEAGFEEHRTVHFVRVGRAGDDLCRSIFPHAS